MYVADSKRLTHAGAKKIVDTAIAKARQAGIAISVVVADSGGHIVVIERMDGGRFHTVHSATTKAVCCASNKRPTSSHGAQGQQLDVAHALGLALAAGPERWTAMEGGFASDLPISPLGSASIDCRADCSHSGEVRNQRSESNAEMTTQ